jgi:hypothetical protein
LIQLQSVGFTLCGHEEHTWERNDHLQFKHRPAAPFLTYERHVPVAIALSASNLPEHSVPLSCRYEEHVGRKTTIRILNIDLLHWPKARGMIAMYTVRSKKDIKKYLKYQEARDLRPVYLFHPEWWCHVWWVT